MPKADDTTARGLHRAEPTRWVFIDSCAVNRFARLNLDPLTALAGSGLAPAATGDLLAEYGRGVAHRAVEPHIKTLLRRLIHGCARIEADAEQAARGADVALAGLSASQIVITLDTKPPWDRARGNPGLVLWSELEPRLRGGETLPTILRERADAIATAHRAGADGSRP